MKIGVIGAGAVGSACLLSVVMRGAAREIVVVNRDRQRAKGVATDLRYGAALSPTVDIHDGDYADLAGFFAMYFPVAGLMRTAADFVNHADESELARVLFEHGGERFARRIARAIVRRRPLRTTGDVVAAVRAAVPRAAWPKRIHVATRTFQALRMAVNDETGALRQTLQEAPGLLAVGGRMGIISFHSGEDRIVKQAFRALAAATFAELEPSPLTPGDDEVRANPRARSAKLRVLERTS